MTEDEKEQAESRRSAAESLREHDRMAALAAAQETKSPYQSGAEISGDETAQEARDRAAHTPGLHERGTRSETEEQKQSRWQWEHREQERDMKEMADAKANERSGVWSKHFEQLKEREKPMKGETKVTPEEQTRVDQALSNSNLAKESIGPASEVSGKPVPNDPGSLDKARDIGQDLNKNGVTMDRE
jgi:hypothetical protein